MVQRDLPWRHTRDPWEVLVAEVMLQQTQVARVAEAWPRFLEEFPTPAACARRPQRDVVAAWEGMGYHRRAVALHRAALEIVERFGGVVPDDEASLESLPGVGPYTARAVLAFAFERDVAVVDTNVARILARAIAGEALTQRAAQTLADNLVVPGTGWSHNQAMLDFGALTCRAEPRCDGCALRRSCRWARADFVEPDPARTTAGTARPQAPFKGSDREVRGQLLARARASAPRAASLDDVTATFGHARVQRLVDALVADGLIVRTGKRVALK